MLLVAGACGQLGNELRLRLGDAAVYVDRDELDITDENAMRSFFLVVFVVIEETIPQRQTFCFSLTDSVSRQEEIVMGEIC